MTPPSPPPLAARANARLQLAALGFLTLFLELALIRYLPASIWNLGYFPNLILIAVFVGMGIGFIAHQRWSDAESERGFRAAAYLLLFLTTFVVLVRPTLPGFTTSQGTVGGETYFTESPFAGNALSPLGLAVWFTGVVAVFALIAQRTAKVFRQFSPLTAYSLDIAGSIAGVLTFTALSAVQMPAWSWFLIVAACVAFVLGRTALRDHPAPVLALIAVSGLVFLQGAVLQPLQYERFAGARRIVRWSPYQRVEYVEGHGGSPQTIFVNGIGHQSMHRDDELVRLFYQYIHDARRATTGVPYRSVLVLGAGSGNDVRAALMNGAGRVDAVEIDPAIAAISRTEHLSRPYDDPRTRLIVDDGRAFLARTDRRYDLIIFALTDSLVKASPTAQLRLENYLFTVEAIRRAAALLTPDGDLVFYNFYRQPWLESKLRSLIAEATGRPPEILWRSGDFAVLVAGAQRTGPLPAERYAVPTDDWPFLYLRAPRLPSMYGYVLLTLICFVLVGGWALGWRRGHASSDHSRTSPLLALAFLAMGIAFLLLETKSVIQFSLLFGTTWTTNAFVFLAVLFLVLAANVAARRLSRTARWPAFALLLLAIGASLAYPIGNLLTIEHPIARLAAASAFTLLPIFFANIIFSVTFRDQPTAERLLGWNLVGAMIGGTVEYMSVIVGYRALGWVVGACYILAVVLIILHEQLTHSRTLAVAEASERRSP